MGGHSEASSSSSGAAAPPTPQQENKQKLLVGELAARSLSRQFEALDVEGDAARSSGAAGGAPPRLGACSSDASSSELRTEDGAADAQASWRQTDHDHEEPILQHNDERFCLLPVK
jgi:hypothetical protein